MIYDAIPVVITAFVTWHIASKRFLVENVTEERRKWREKVRETALRVHDAIISDDKAKIRRLRNEFRTRLNPADPDDKEIIKCICSHDDTEENRLDRAEKFARRIALLLKHDWERAKREARIFPFLRCKKKRIPFGAEDNYKEPFCCRVIVIPSLVVLIIGAIVSIYCAGLCRFFGIAQ